MSITQALARFLKGLKKDLPRIVKKEIYKRVGWPGYIIPWKNAQKPLNSILNDLGTLETNLRKADAKHAKGSIIRLIDTVLKARLNVSIPGKKIINNKSIWDYTGPEQKNKLDKTRTFVEKIPAQKLVAENTKKDIQKFLSQYDIAKEIAKAVKSSGGSIPQIEHIQWETTQLIKLSATSKVTIEGKYKSKTFKIQALLDLAHPASSSRDITRAIVEAIAK